MLKKIIIAEILTLSIFLFGLFLGTLISKKPIIKQTTTNSFSATAPKAINQNNPEKGKYNVLLLGYGGAGHEGSLLTDSIIVIHVDTIGEE